MAVSFLCEHIHVFTVFKVQLYFIATQHFDYYASVVMSLLTITHYYSPLLAKGNFLYTTLLDVLSSMLASTFNLGYLTTWQFCVSGEPMPLTLLRHIVTVNPNAVLTYLRERLVEHNSLFCCRIGKGKSPSRCGACVACSLPVHGSFDHQVARIAISAPGRGTDCSLGGRNPKKRN